MLQDPKHTSGPSTSNRHEGQAEYLVQAGHVSGGITINAVHSPRRRWPWRLLGAVGATVLIGYLLNSGPEAPPPAGTDDQLTGSPMEEPVQLRSLESDFCAAVPGDYGLVKQLPCNGAASSAQLWNMAGPDSSTTFARTRNRDTEICLELSGHGSRPHGTEVQVAHCNDSRADNQLWKVERGDRPDTVRIRNAVSDQRCLSPATTKPGSPLVIKDCAGGHGSQWQVIPQHTAP